MAHSGGSARRREDWRRRCRALLACFYGLAGILHLAFPRPFLSITPSWVPQPETVVFLTGLAEVSGAVCLLLPCLRRYAGVGLALYAVCVFPANVKHAMDALESAEASLWQWLYHSLRLPFQPVLVWLPLFATGFLMKESADRSSQRR
jgi:uncharacterized membrane protein